MATTGSFLGDIEAALLALLEDLVYSGPLESTPLGMLRAPVRPALIPSDADAETLFAMLKEQTPGAMLSTPSFGVTYPLQSGWSDLPLEYRLIFATDRAGADGMDQDQARRLDAYKFFDAAFAALFQKSFNIPEDSPIPSKRKVQFIEPQSVGFVNASAETGATLFAINFIVPIHGVAFACRDF